MPVPQQANGWALLGVGVACLDLVWQVGTYPAEDTKTQALGMLTQGGGPVGTALVAAARLGLRVSYFGTLGDDMAGQAIAAGLVSDGVDIAHLRLIPGASSHTAVVLVSGDYGRRTVVWHPGNVPPPDPQALPDEELRWSAFLHLDGHHPEAALPLARRARSLGVRVSLDAGSNYPWLADLVPLADVVIGSERFARDFTGEVEPNAMVDRLARYGPAIVGVTMGGAGGVIEAAGVRFVYPALPVVPVDTNGAGDVFHGAFLAALVLGLGPRDAAVFASATAAIKCTALGGRTGIPDRRGVLAFLAARDLLTGDLRSLAEQP